MILRFRDLITQEGGTIEAHRALIQRYGYVWWGWWAMPEESIPRNTFAAFGDEINSRGELTAYLLDSGLKRLYTVRISQIDYPQTNEPMPTPDPEKTPRYYIDNTCKAWFKILSIQDCKPVTLRELTYDDVKEFMNDPTSDAFEDKRIFSVDELLGRVHRTIFFVKQYEVGHKDYEVKLTSGRRPILFRTEPTFIGSSYIIHLSDLHFGKQSFPSNDNSPPAKSLASLLISDLENFGRGPPAAVIISGDLTWFGHDEEFQEAQKFILKLRSAFNLDLSYQLVVVPGNHDIQWSPQSGDYDPKRQVEYSTDIAQRNYKQFFAKVLEIAPNAYLSMGRRFVLSNYVSVDIIGLNSTRLESRHHAGFGFVGKDQIDDAFRQMKWVPGSAKTTYRVAVMHHHVVPVSPIESISTDDPSLINSVTIWPVTGPSVKPS